VWRELRSEALFYALDGLLAGATLNVTNNSRSSRAKLDGKGFLHWLGTENKGKSEYCNPHATGAVHVGGWSDLSHEN
jgi:hypothetical protein